MTIASRTLRSMRKARYVTGERYFECKALADQMRITQLESALQAIANTYPVEHTFNSRAKALAKINEFYRYAPYVRIEMLEATEYGTRSRSTKKKK